jgi:hypothetical protein
VFGASLRNQAVGAFLTLVMAAALIGATAPTAATVGRQGPHPALSFSRHVNLVALRAATPGWHGGLTIAADGESLTIYISDSYPLEQVTAQSWADWFTQLIHSGEFSHLVVYIATPSEEQQICGPDALGCTGGLRIVIPGEAMHGLSPGTIATHEYAHHILDNRLNPPWDAADYGTKRWASALAVCSRAATGQMFPGDEGAHYRLNPGEGFAEAYRILNETRSGASVFSWPIVDNLFYPDATALQALEQDVRTPWTGPATNTRTLTFTRSGPRMVRLTLSTPLDGVVTASIRIPATALYDMRLLSTDRKTVLARAIWTGEGHKDLRATICGQRSPVLEITRSGPSGAITLQVATP